MGEIINLRRARKRARKAEDATEAAGNRVRFGRTRAEAASDAARADRAARILDGARLDQSTDGPLGDAKRAKARDTSS